MDGSVPEIAAGEWQERIRALEEQGRRAFLAQDVEALRRLWSEELLVNSPLDRVNDREQILGLLAGGVIRHLTYEIEIETLRRIGDLVVAMGHDVVTNAPGEAPRRRRFTDLWREEGDGWRMVARHASYVAGG